jgi:hypothetical protein
VGQPLIRSGLVGRFRASDLSALSDGATVGTWSNARANSLVTPMAALTQVTEASKPTKQTVSGRPVLRFDGAGDWLTGALPFSSGPFSIIVVARRIGAGEANGRLWEIAGQALVYNVSTRWEWAFPVITSSANTADNWNVITAVHTPTAVDLRINGTTVAAGNPTDLSVNGFSVGANGGGEENANVEVQDLLVYNRALRAGEHKSVGRSLSDHYGLGTML